MLRFIVIVAVAQIVVAQDGGTTTGVEGEPQKIKLIELKPVHSLNADASKFPTLAAPKTYFLSDAAVSPFLLKLIYASRNLRLILPNCRRIGSPLGRRVLRVACKSFKLRMRPSSGTLNFISSIMVCMMMCGSVWTTFGLRENGNGKMALWWFILTGSLAIKIALLIPEIVSLLKLEYTSGMNFPAMSEPQVIYPWNSCAKRLIISCYICSYWMPQAKSE